MDLDELVLSTFIEDDLKTELTRKISEIKFESSCENRWKEQQGLQVM